MLAHQQVRAAAQEFGTQVIRAALEQHHAMPAVSNVSWAASTEAAAKDASDALRKLGSAFIEDVRRERAPTALIIGMKYSQHSPYNRRYDGKLRLKYWHDESTSALVDKARAADVIFVAGKNVAHQTLDTINSTTGGRGKTLRSQGGMTEMFSLIDRWLQERSGAGA